MKMDDIEEFELEMAAYARRAPHIKARVLQIDRLADAYRQQRQLSNLAFGMLLMADLMSYSARRCTASLDTLLMQARRHVLAERNPEAGSIWVESPEDRAEWPAEMAADRERRFAALSQARKILNSELSCPDRFVADALADLGHWCEVRSIQPPDRLRETVEMLNPTERYLLH